MNKQIREDINRVIELNKILESQSEMGESGFSSVGRQLRGLNPKVQTIAILTGENPCSTPLTPRENNELNRKLTDHLSNEYYDFINGKRIGYRPVKGKYGSPENSFIVNNITKDDAMKIGSDFEQESIVYGERYEEGDEYGMKFQLIVSHPCPTTEDPVGTVWGETKVFINVRKNANDLYTEVKGRKFSIPFFKVDAYEKDLDSDGKEQKDQDGEIKLKKVGTKDYDKASWEKGSGKIKDINFIPDPVPVNEWIYISESIYKPNQIYKDIPNELNEQIDRAVRGSLSAPNSISRKVRRGFIITKLRKYCK